MFHHSRHLGSYRENIRGSVRQGHFDRAADGHRRQTWASETLLSHTQISLFSLLSFPRPNACMPFFLWIKMAVLTPKPGSLFLFSLELVGSAAKSLLIKCQNSWARLSRTSNLRGVYMSIMQTVLSHRKDLQSRPSLSLYWCAYFYFLLAWQGGEMLNPA